MLFAEQGHNVTTDNLHLPMKYSFLPSWVQETHQFLQSERFRHHVKAYGSLLRIGHFGSFLH
ncbi:hypothetical protein EVA_15559 [gut metagenome]|uniref:Uncharacterized protein n=1 Tax=gut metagenome TaxID=749906 RepID=J9FPD8_9ZZZZ